MTVVNESATVIWTEDGGVPISISVFTSGAVQSAGCFAKSKYFDLADYNEQIDPEGLKTVKAIMFDVQDANKPEFLTVAVSIKENVNDAEVWGPFETVVPGVPLDLRLDKCRYMAFWLKDTGPTTDYEISRVTIFGTARRKGSRK